MGTDRKVALITGAGRGIGFGIAKSLAGEGCDIVMCDIHEKDLVAEALKELEVLGAEVLYCKADVSDDAARKTMMGEIRDKFGRLDVLVNNAGVAPKVRASVLEATEASFERLIKIKLQGPYFLTQLAANWRVEQKRATEGCEGCIINISF